MSFWQKHQNRVKVNFGVEYFCRQGSGPTKTLSLLHLFWASNCVGAWCGCGTNQVIVLRRTFFSIAETLRQVSCTSRCVLIERGLVNKMINCKNFQAIFSVWFFGILSEPKENNNAWSFVLACRWGRLHYICSMLDVTTWLNLWIFFALQLTYLRYANIGAAAVRGALKEASRAEVCCIWSICSKHNAIRHKVAHIFQALKRGAIHFRRTVYDNAKGVRYLSYCDVCVPVRCS